MIAVGTDAIRHDGFCLQLDGSGCTLTVPTGRSETVDASRLPTISNISIHHFSSVETIPEFSQSGYRFPRAAANALVLDIIFTVRVAYSYCFRLISLWCFQ